MPKDGASISKFKALKPKLIKKIYNFCIPNVFTFQVFKILI